MPFNKEDKEGFKTAIDLWYILSQERAIFQIDGSHDFPETSPVSTLHSGMELEMGN